MPEVAKTLQHYGARLDLWWSRVQRGERERRARQLASDRVRMAQAATAPGWRQHPKEPPGYLRWWDGGRWTEHTQRSAEIVKAEGRQQSTGLTVAGVITFLVGLFFWPLFLATFVIGIVLATKPGRGGDGAILIVLSVLGPIVSIIGVVALISGGS